MPRSHPPYPPEFRQQMVELVRVVCWKYSPMGPTRSMSVWRLFLHIGNQAWLGGVTRFGKMHLVTSPIGVVLATITSIRLVWTSDHLTGRG